MLTDAPELDRIQKASFRADFERYGECPPYEEDVAFMEGLIREAVVYRILADGQAVGVIVMRIRDDSYYLRDLSVLPEFQGKGVGSRAVELLELKHTEHKLWRLITPKDNRRNRYFYEKLGYRAVGETKQSDKLTLLHYEKRLG